MAVPGLHAVPRQVSMHVQQLSWQDAIVPEVGRLLIRLVGHHAGTAVRRRGGRKELFQTADQTLSADGSRLVGTVMGNTEHERETPMGVTGALESVHRHAE